jgi:hypothetical protein
MVCQVSRVALETNTGMSVRFVEFESDIPDRYSWENYSRKICTHESTIRLIADRLSSQNDKNLVLSKYNDMTEQLHNSVANSVMLTAKTHVISIRTSIMAFARLLCRCS